MSAPVTLASTELLPGKPFTHPDHTQTDRAALVYMAGQLNLVLSFSGLDLSEPRTMCLQQPGHPDWLHRVVLVQPARLREWQEITVVGFFGQCSHYADRNTAAEFDTLLRDEFPQQPGLLSYSSTVLADGNYGNLVLFASPDAPAQWSRSRTHSHAATVFAPGYYDSIRIYNGLMPGGLDSAENLQLHRVKYFDYQSTPLWRGERILM